MDESWIVINDNPLAEPYDYKREETIRKVHANHLQTVITTVMRSEADKVPSFKVLKEKYCSRLVDFEMSPEETEYRKVLL